MQEINEDLLLAALAVLTGALRRDELHAAMAALSARPEGRLEEVFREQGLLDGPRIGALRVLAAGHLERHNGDLLSSLQAWNAETLTHEILTEIEDAAPRTLLAQTLAEALGSTIRAPERPPGDDPEATAALGAGPAAGAGAAAGAGPGAGRARELPRLTQEQRFQRINLHARGGIGQVWRARDLELQRDVALKEIQPEFAGRADQNDRFLLEAEITGNLEHPGIVPVYSLGSDARGRPFYAMRLIRGESLSEAIRRFHRGRDEPAAGRRRGRSEWGVEFQQLLRRFLEVCDAMEYAHSRGVLHRDLKPANIMLGEYGETLIVDWGLAKVLGRADVAAGAPPAAGGEPAAGEPAGGDGEATSPPPPPAEGIGTPPADRTMQGTKMGTPSYMSPEQARGDIDKLGKASDVYSLGATLYELLAGRRPLADLKPHEILVRVASGDVPPPRAVLATIPPALEAVCRKAMAFLPEDRYPSARELALDLEHWIADEPVSAFPEGRTQRLSRWLRRHRTWTYAAAASLVAITLISTAAMIRLDAARNDAEANFEAALDAVNRYLTGVSENELLKKYDTLDVSELRRELLGTALPFYKEFVKKRGQDPRLREQLAGAYYRLGDISRFVSPTSEALAYYRSSLDLWRALAAAAPEDPARRLRVADCLFAIGEITDAAHSEDAVASLSEAMTIYERASEARPQEPRFRRMVASCLSEIGYRHSLASRPEEAMDALHRAREILEALIAAAPGDDLDYKKALAFVIDRMGFVEYHRGRGDAAMRSYGEFQKVCREIFDGVKEGPKPLELQHMLATSYENIGAIRVDQGLRESALRAYREAESYRLRLVELAGSVREYQAALARNEWSMAHVEHDLGHPAEALALAARSRAILEKLRGDDPDEPSYRRQLARVATLEGVIHDEARRNDLALKPFEEALGLQEQIEPGAGDDPELKNEICVSLSNLGETHADMGRPDLAMPHFREALDRRIALLAARPDVPAYAAQLAGLAIAMGDIERQQADPSSAAATFARARDALDRIPAPAPDEGVLAALRAQLLDREARALAERGEAPEASGRLERAATLAREALRREAPDGAAAGSLRGALSETLRDLAGLPRPGPHGPRADRLRAERADLWKARPPREPLDLAAREAASANCIGYGETPLPPAGEEARRSDRGVAISHLRIAIRRGLPDPDALRSQPDLGPLLRDGPAWPDEEFPDIPAQPFRL
ncbi:Serine/threonine-protein kinase PknD [Aquisphaera giovannonii]|uniref:Serine/threonine-protein kinase PknD n=1 Tax=Aquisphaera giovannonii TaxID=406548 RepID=A0A5B9W7F2_9BACT|nr:serine/threonine-protein kinase [Aquisphaera giovannonii]QEH36015.1 Serine/threonine-protein kinase PknD [Aquisphaera giovannonii]